MNRRGARPPLADETGSILPLMLGAVVLVLALLLVSANATSLYLAQKRLDALADAAALAAADGFAISLEGDDVRARLEESAVREQAAAVVAASPAEALLVEASVPDGTSARIVLVAEWRPFAFGLPLPALVPLQSTAVSRTALR